MKNMKHISKILTQYLLFFLFFSCSSDDQADFLKRDTDVLSFSYIEESLPFTIRSNVSWQVVTTDDWITISPNSGSGQAIEHEEVLVTVSHNNSSKREGIVIIKSSKGEAQVKVYQENGFFEWNEPFFEGRLFEGEKLNNAYLCIPYNKASGKEVIAVKSRLQGEGAGGIQVEDVDDYLLTPGKGAVLLKLSGVPSSMGEIWAEIELVEEGQDSPKKITSKSSFVSSDNIIFEMNFDKFIWGGNYMLNLPGVSAELGFDVSVSDEVTRICKPADDGTSDLFSEKMNSAFFNARGLTGWSGSKGYEKPGYIKLGTGKAKGYIISPLLDLEQLGCLPVTDLYVQFDWARWDNENDPIEITLIGDGELEKIDLTEIHEQRVWQQKTFKIKNATNKTQVKVSSTVAGNNRFFITNWKFYASRVSDSEVTSKLENPQNLSCIEATVSSLELVWDEVRGASLYEVELLTSTGEKVENMTVNSTTVIFKDLKPATNYQWRVKAIYTPKTEYNSDFSVLATGYTLRGELMEAPNVALYKASHGLLVFDFGLYNPDENISRIYSFELAKTENGKAIRKYTKKDLESGIATTAGDNGTGTRLNYFVNRIAFGALEANTTYYLRVIHHAAPETEYIDSEVVTCMGKTEAKPTLGGNVLIYKDFEDFWWGGNSINQAWGAMPLVKPINEQIKASSLNEYNDFYIHYPIRNAGDSFNTLAADKAPEYFKSRWGDDGWNGKKVYEVTGHLKLGTASASGWLTTPALSKLSKSSRVKLTFKSAPYHELTRGEDMLGCKVQVVGDGTIVNQGHGKLSADKKEIELTNKTNSNGGPKLISGEYEWTIHTVVVEGATANTKLTIGTQEYDKAKSSEKVRMWLDDIMVVKE